jgi:alcohol dehydrogenase
MSATTGEFRFTRLENVIFGAESVERLGRELDRHGVRRALLVTGKTLGRSKLLDAVKRAAGRALAGVFAGTAQHAPSKTIEALAAEARRVDADGFVSFGGGSPIDSAKAAAFTLMGGRPGPLGEARPAPRDAREYPHVAIPTTLSAAEFTPGGGVTNEGTREKGGVWDPRLQARTVILDPTLTVETPAWLWAGTGMRALDHAVESAYSVRRQPLTDTLAARAIAMLVEHLKPSMSAGISEQLEHRLQCQLAAWLSIFGAMNTRFGISHALGHQIGPYWDVPHGHTSCITLPHVMRFMAGIAPERFAAIADGFGIRFDAANPKPAALECADRAAAFIRQFEVPTRLRDASVPHDQLARIADTVLAEVSGGGAVGRPVTRDDLVALLEAAY